MATAPQKKTAQVPKTTTDPAADSAADSAVYTVHDTLHHDGKAYGAGDLVELTAAQAAALPAGIVALA